MFTLSVCMIVKDEEKTLARVLDCARQFADEIVVVDTGSTDKSVQIAKTFTQNVFNFKWCDDFSAARNFSFSKATSKYIMWLDADDFLPESSIQKLQNLKNSNADADVFMCKYCAGQKADGGWQLEFFRERILRREKQFLWQGFVHEVIAPSGKIEWLDIEIWHKKEKAPDANRNLDLYEKAKKRGVKFSPRETYYYARELFYHQKYSESAANLRKFLRENGTYPPDVLGARLMLAQIQKLQNRSDLALKTLFDALCNSVPNSEVCCQIGYILEEQNKIPQAIFFFECALKCPPQKDGFINRDFQQYLPCLELSKLYSATNKTLAKIFLERSNFSFGKKKS